MPVMGVGGDLDEGAPVGRSERTRRTRRILVDATVDRLRS